jgi:hypothetical protein
MKKLRDKPEKMAKINSQVMETNMKYMTHSMRPTLFTFLPLIIIFGWLGSHLAYYPLQPNTVFDITAQFKNPEGTATLTVPEELTIMDEAQKQIITEEVDWKVQGPEGEFTVQLEHAGNTFEKQVIISSQRQYAPVEKTYKDNLEKITLSNEKIRPFSDVPLLKNIPWLNTWSWLGAYLLFSIVFSMSWRRVLKIY